MSFILCYIAVYPLVADWAVDKLAHPANLFRAPVCGQCHAHELDGICRETTLLTCPSPSDGSLVSELRQIALLISITTKLATDSRWMNSNLFGNAGLAQAMVTKEGDLVS